jgi:hypothetical protein
MCKCIAKFMYLVSSKRYTIWNSGSSFIHDESFHFYNHMKHLKMLVNSHVLEKNCFAKKGNTNKQVGWPESLDLMPEIGSCFFCQREKRRKTDDAGQS